MLKQLLITSGILFFCMNTYAQRAVRIDVKDFKTSETRSRKATEIKDSVRDMTGSEKLSSEFGRIITETSRLDSKSQKELAQSLNACVRGLESYSKRSGNIEISKIEDVVASVLDAAFIIKANEFQNKSTKNMASMLFSLVGPRLKEKLENESVEYDLNKMQKVAEMVKASAGRRSLNEEGIKKLSDEMLKELNAKTFKEVVDCKA